MNYLLLTLALALAPVVAIILYFRYLDRFNREPIRMLLLTFVFGVLSTIPAVALELAGAKLLPGLPKLAADWVNAFIIIALSEEFAKYIFLRRFVYRNHHFDEPFDGIIYALMVSMGFAALENVLYVVMAGNDGVQVAMLRMFTAVPAHATFAVLMGYWIGRAKMENKPRLDMLGLFSAVLFHGLYDFFLLADLFAGQAIGAFMSLIVGIILSRSAIKIHRAHIQKS